MTNRVREILLTGLALSLVVGPALAGAIRVPEPASMSLMLVGVGAAFVARKFVGRK